MSDKKSTDCPMRRHRIYTKELARQAWRDTLPVFGDPWFYTFSLIVGTFFYWLVRG